MKCTDKDIAEVLDGFEEEMLADLERRNGLRPGSIPRTEGKPKAKFPGLRIDRQREVLREAERRLIQEEKLNIEEGRRANRAWIEERKQMGEYHASQKRMHMEAEYWAKEAGRNQSGYDPIKLFQEEMEKEIGNG